MTENTKLLDDPNQGYYGQQPGYPPPNAPYTGAPQQGFQEGPGYPGAGPGYPGAGPGYPGAGPGYPGAGPGYPGAGPGYPGAGPGYPGSQGGGFIPPPQGIPYGHVPTDQPFNQPAGMYGGTSYPSDDPGEVKGFDFSEQYIRKAFIRKVYSILMVQLFITLGFIALFLYHKPAHEWIQKNPAIWWVALVVMLVTLIAMACCGEVRRKPPMNFIFLFLFTIAEAFMLSMCASNYNSEEVLMAVGITAVVCLGLTLFAFQTKVDFTMMGGVLFVAVLILFVFGIAAIFIKGKIMTLVYASLGALIFSVYLIYDTQLMMGGKHKYSISPEEYIFAALNLYMDIVNIFLYILTIIGASRD